MSEKLRLKIEIAKASIAYVHAASCLYGSGLGDSYRKFLDEQAEELERLSLEVDALDTTSIVEVQQSKDFWELLDKRLLDKDVNFIAKDECGTWWAYTGKPTCGTIGWSSTGSGKCYEIDDETAQVINHNYPNIRWTESVIQRPNSM